MVPENDEVAARRFNDVVKSAAKLILNLAERRCIGFEDHPDYTPKEVGWLNLCIHITGSGIGGYRCDYQLQGSWDEKYMDDEVARLLPICEIVLLLILKTEGLKPPRLFKSTSQSRELFDRDSPRS